jgi:osmotically-inducible protein OsmY
MRLIWLAAGAALVYFLDSQRGAKRRNDLRNRVTSKARHGAHDAEGALKDASNRAKGAVASATPSSAEQPNDPTLAAKVESEIFRDPAVPQGQINVSAQNGVIVLIGEVEDPQLITGLEEATRKVDGVTGVRNLLHEKGTPAPQM